MAFFHFTNIWRNDHDDGVLAPLVLVDTLGTSNASESGVSPGGQLTINQLGIDNRWQAWAAVNPVAVYHNESLDPFRIMRWEIKIDSVTMDWGATCGMSMGDPGNTRALQFFLYRNGVNGNYYVRLKRLVATVTEYDWISASLGATPPTPIWLRVYQNRLYAGVDPALPEPSNPLVLANDKYAAYWSTDGVNYNFAFTGDSYIATGYDIFSAVCHTQNSYQPAFSQMLSSYMKIDQYLEKPPGFIITDLDPADDFEARTQQDELPLRSVLDAISTEDAPVIPPFSPPDP